MRRETVLSAACLALVSFGMSAGGPISPSVEFQSRPLTPGIVLDESQRPVHQIRLLAEARGDEGGRGTLVLDPNPPEFDEFGNLVGGIRTPQVSGKGGAPPAMELECVIEFVKARQDEWRLFRLRGPKITSPLFLSTRGRLGDAGPARLVLLGGDGRVVAVVDVTVYGLLVP
jgi:hypothetical protein